MGLNTHRQKLPHLLLNRNKLAHTITRSRSPSHLGTNSIVGQTDCLYVQAGYFYNGTAALACPADTSSVARLKSSAVAASCTAW